MSGSYDEALAAARRAVALQPGDPETHGYLSVLMTFSGFAAEAISHVEHAIRLNPISPGVFLNYSGYANAMAGHSEAAITALNKIVPGAYSPITFSMLILAYIETGNVQNAKETAEFALEKYPHMTTSSWTTIAFKNQDDVERVASSLREAGIPD